MSSNSSQDRKAVPRTSFYSLPQELRDRIYDLTLRSVRPVKLTRRFSSSSGQTDVVAIECLSEIDPPALEYALSKNPKIVFTVDSRELLAFPTYRSSVLDGGGGVASKGLKSRMRRLVVYLPMCDMTNKVIDAIPRILPCFPGLEHFDLRFICGGKHLLPAKFSQVYCRFCHKLKQMRTQLKTLNIQCVERYPFPIPDCVVAEEDILGLARSRPQWSDLDLACEIGALLLPVNYTVPFNLKVNSFIMHLTHSGRILARVRARNYARRVAEIAGVPFI